VSSRRFISILMVGLLLLTGCTLPAAPEEKARLVVMHDSETAFNAVFGGFRTEQPDVALEIVPAAPVQQPDADEQTLLEYLEVYKPDILMLTPAQYAQLADAGRLLDLSSFATEIALESRLLPGMLPLLQELGGGRLLGLSPSFIGRALYYNADLFRQFGVELPRDGMSWDEVAALAASLDGRQAAGAAVRGYEHPGADASHLYALAAEIGRTNGLRVFDPVKKQLTLAGDGWTSAVELAIKLAGNGEATDQADPALPTSRFLEGTAAMTMDGPYLTKELERKRAFEWGIVTAPVDPAVPDGTRSVFPYPIFAVRTDSAHVKQAHKLLDYMLGDEAARRIAGGGNLLPSAAADTRDREAFYALRPLPSETARRSMAPDTERQIAELADRELYKAYTGGQTIEEALAAITEQGNRVLAVN